MLTYYIIVLLTLSGKRIALLLSHVTARSVNTLAATVTYEMKLLTTQKTGPNTQVLSLMKTKEKMQLRVARRISDIVRFTKK